MLPKQAPQSSSSKATLSLILFALIALLACLGLALSIYLRGKNVPSVYEASVSVLASTDTVGISDLVASATTSALVDASAYEAAATSLTVLAKALEHLGDLAVSQEAISKLKEQTTVTAQKAESSSLIHILVQDSSAKQAARKANALAAALVAWDARRANEQLERVVMSFEKEMEALDQQIFTLQSTGATQQEVDGQLFLRAQQAQQLLYAELLLSSASGRLEILDVALEPTEPIATEALRDALLSLAASLLLVLLVFIVILLFRARSRSLKTVARLVDLPLMAELSKSSVSAGRLESNVAQALCNNLLFATYNHAKKVILVSSAQTSEGTSTVALSVAEGFANNDYKTLLIDANLRSPAVFKDYALKAEDHVSLQALLEDSQLTAEPARIALKDDAKLDVIATFETLAAPAELLNKGFRERLEQWRQDYDIIVIDSAPLLPVSDTLAIAPFCTGMVFVSSLQTNPAMLSPALDFLKRMGINLLGIVSTEATAKPRLEKRHLVKQTKQFAKQTDSSSLAKDLKPVSSHL